LELLALARELTMRRRYAMSGLPIMDVMAARVHTELGNLDTAIDLSRAALDEVLEGGGTLWAPVAANVLVEALVTRGANGDLDHAQTAVDRLAAVPIEPGLVLYDIWLLRLRALLAHARGDDVSYRGFADRYRKMATDLGFEGHMAMAEAMR
jgi:adenylate cyclase